MQRELPTRKEVECYLADRRNWGRWKENPSAGTINLITSKKIVDASRLVKTGESISLSNPLPVESSPANSRPVDFYLKKLDWIDQGAEQGDPDLEYPIPDYPDGSNLGEPDLSFEMEESFFIEGNFQDDYRCFVFSLDNDEPISMSAIEFNPGNREAVHHAIITYVPHGAADNLENEDNEYGYDCYGGFELDVLTDLIGGYAPGLSVVKYPENIGRTIPTNSDIIVQVHYAPLMHDAEDQSSINLFFKDGPIEREIDQEIFSYWEFYLPANQETTVTRTLYIPSSVSMVNILPHCHLLGKSWEIYATTWGGDIIPIIKIDDWDFDWQSFYYP